MEIITARLRLRTPTLADASFIAREVNDWDIVKHMLPSIPHPYVEADAVFYLSQILLPKVEKNEAFPFLIEEKETGNPMGLINYELKETSNCFERGFWLAKEFHGNGYMTEATNATNTYMFESVGLSEIRTRNAIENQASDNIKLKQGWQKIGKGTAIYHIGEVEENRWLLTKEAWLKNQNLLRDESI